MELAGGGTSAGYHWMLDNHWNIETSLGVGYDFIRAWQQYNWVSRNAPDYETKVIIIT